MKSSQKVKLLVWTVIQQKRTFLINSYNMALNGEVGEDCRTNCSVMFTSLLDL